MCGFAGFIGFPGHTDSLLPTVRRMADRLTQRGPDDSGAWADRDAGLALGHRRLAVLDLSPAGHQPMVSASGRWVLAFNGEIYNHLDLRAELEAAGTAPTWHGTSDTETLLAMVETHGVEGALSHLEGMFAFALWDCEARRLHLARDRFGEKPLYYGWQGDSFLFGSELKALRAWPRFDAAIDRGVLALYLRYGYVPAPYSIYQRIFKLEPGHLLALDSTDGSCKDKTYWSVADVVRQGLSSPMDIGDREAVDLLQQHLSDSVESQMISDVPLGALLSGGVDSTMVTALMQAASSRPVRTFTIGFENKHYNEARHAAAVAEHLGTDHTELILGPDDALELIPSVPDVYDEPFADASQLPTLLVMQLARRSVTVALSGDGGDEVFGGYNRYVHAPRMWRRFGRWPAWLRRAMGGGLTAMPSGALNRLAGPLAGRFGIDTPGDKAHKLGQRLQYLSSPDRFYQSLVSSWQKPEALVTDCGELPHHLLDSTQDWPEAGDFARRMMAVDMQTYLSDDILVKVDRAAMSVSLETRAPFLDHRLVEFAWRLPMHQLIRNGQGKWLVRELLERYVPKSLTDRPKTGFAVPLDAWLRGPLREWADTLLDPERLRKEGYLDPEPIQHAWRRHIQGKEDRGTQLWNVLMFQAWLERQQAA